MFFLFFFFASVDALAQENKPVLISGDFRGVTIDEFVKQIEAKTSFHFYFDPVHFDLLVINVEVKEKPLEYVLNEIFKNSEYNFTIDQQRIFLSKGQSIKTTLSAETITSFNIGISSISDTLNSPSE